MEKENILYILRNAIKAIKDNDVVLLKDLSNRTVHSSSIQQDENNITIAVLVYSLSKIFERSKYQQYKDWKIFYDTCLKSLNKAEESLARDKVEEYNSAIRNILFFVDKLDSKLKLYIQDVFYRSKINKASRLYEHGLSIGKTAELLGVNEWEIMDYVGKTGIADAKFSISKDALERLKIARSLFEKWNV